MAELIAGRFRSRGEGIALWLSREVTGAPHDEVVSSPQIRGPFVVVSCWLRAREPWAHSGELLVTGVGVGGSLGFGGGRTIGGFRLMEAGVRQVRDGSTTLVDPGGEATVSGRRVGETWYPFYVYEGASGAIVLVVRRHDLAGVVCKWNAGVTIWPLEEVVA